MCVSQQHYSMTAWRVSVTKNVPFVEFEGLIRVTSDNMAGWDIVMRPCFRQLKVNSCALKFLGFWVT